MRPSLSPPMRMHLCGDGDGDGDGAEIFGGDDSNATRLGKALYWKRFPVNVPYGETGGMEFVGDIGLDWLIDLVDEVNYEIMF